MVNKIIVYYNKDILAKHLEQIIKELMTLISCFVFPKRGGIQFLSVKFVVVCFQDEPLETIVSK